MQVLFVVWRKVLVYSSRRENNLTLLIKRLTLGSGSSESRKQILQENGWGWGLNKHYRTEKTNLLGILGGIGDSPKQAKIFGLRLTDTHSAECYKRIAEPTPERKLISCCLSVKFGPVIL